MPLSSSDTFHVSPTYQPLVRELGLDAEAVFTDPRIVVWRSITERENCTLDADLADGRHVRWHFKRHRAARGRETPADEEVRGVQLLEQHGIPTVRLVGWGRLADGRTFVISEDLAGFRAADKLLAEGAASFEQLLEPTAKLAADLHRKGLHHRDLYLCHLFTRLTGEGVDLRLIDAARVRPLPRWFRNRWIVKDLAQFWYSTLALPVTDDQRNRWLTTYARHRGLPDGESLRRAVVRKSDSIASHDRRLRARQPTRNVSIPRDCDRHRA